MNKLRTLLLSTLAIIAVCLTACAQTRKEQTMKGSKVLAAYFSATRTTKAAAQRLASVTDEELYEIQPGQPYTDADLNWNDRQSRSSVEMNNPQSRPAIKGKKEDMADYDVYSSAIPSLAPTIVNTFIESHDLKGKTVIPFATSDGSSIENSVSALKNAYPEIRWRNGRLLNRASDKSIREWVDEVLK